MFSDEAMFENDLVGKRKLKACPRCGRVFAPSVDVIPPHDIPGIKAMCPASYPRPDESGQPTAGDAAQEELTDGHEG